MGEVSATATTISGDTIVLDISAENVYGFQPGQIVHFTKSLRNRKVALIRGISEGLLWFAVLPDVASAASKQALHAPVSTVSCRGKEELIRQYGWMVDDTSNPFAVAPAP
ncbi:conserved hypothetical protein [Leishmania infantum JPCM5]|uniref:Uncharacterized protein n=2 Tax=Leishmania infantum TaxID=5671 RepID=A4I8L8_LEIIN|nr:conserved hypothetical protein [Leishmania infantum JPCM5]CAC9529242.1 hypothetical_protein_-_conserved [Leishmania infantum]CAM71164.1 conserved hypothetical protein [Leishmania infantum JPCM5]SUZ44989.1 hypothetical_protein_-_conserved [Leishmania infantum]|eukprot:XP_001468087.1 conserved hypothetical protein [Leishmania infantum JPCM5]